MQRGWIEVHVPEYKPGNGFPVSYSETETKAIATQAVLDGWTP